MKILPLHIAWRYLHSKKSYNAINIVSGVSAAAVAVVTAAMICVLSVMNGFGVIIEGMFSQFDPDIRITPKEGKYFTTDTPLFDSIKALPGVGMYTEVVEETALIEYEDHQLAATLKGVDSTYQSLTKIDSILTDGHFLVYDGAFERTVMGQGLAWQLGVGAHFVKGIHIYAPKRNERVNLMRPDQAFRQATVFIAGTFAVNQVQYDDHLMLVSLNMARHLFDYAPNQATGIELSVADGQSVRQVKRQIRSILGDEYLVLDRYEQQADFFHILQIEKWLTALLMVFILLIASFNLVGSLSMLMLDKEADVRILQALGADDGLIRRIFLMEGWLISAFGALGGVVLGLIMCLTQQYFGWLRLGSGTEYVLEAYPVAVAAGDVLLVVAIVLLIGFVAAWIPTRHVRHT